jgi:hypothetical protein
MLAIIIGGLFTAAGLIGLIRWWTLTIDVLKGVLPLLFIGGGLVSIIAGYTSIRDALFSKKIVDETEKESK